VARHRRQQADEHDHDHDEERREAEAEARRRHALAQIRQYPDVALRLAAKDVDEFDDDLRRLVERMERLMWDAQGIGLAATQVGVLRRVFVFAPDEDGSRAVVNPRIVERSDETVTEEEGCLSLQGVRVPVERAARIVLEGKDAAGDDVRYELEGMGARAAQHESDHLDGVLIIDRTDEEHRRQALGVLRPQPILG
jgi:peptide deformylase